MSPDLYVKSTHYRIQSDLPINVHISFTFTILVTICISYLKNLEMLQIKKTRKKFKHYEPLEFKMLSQGLSSVHDEIKEVETTIFFTLSSTIFLFFALSKDD